MIYLAKIVVTEVNAFKGISYYWYLFIRFSLGWRFCLMLPLRFTQLILWKYYSLGIRWLQFHLKVKYWESDASVYSFNILDKSFYYIYEGTQMYSIRETFTFTAIYYVLYLNEVYDGMTFIQIMLLQRARIIHSNWTGFFSIFWEYYKKSLLNLNNSNL